MLRPSRIAWRGRLCNVTQFIMCYVMCGIRFKFLKKMESKSKYVVAFAQEGPMVRIAELADDVTAVQFAINLHRSSNLKHSVFVFENDNVEPLVVFTVK